MRWPGSSTCWCLCKSGECRSDALFGFPARSNPGEHRRMVWAMTLEDKFCGRTGSSHGQSGSGGAGLLGQQVVWK